MKKRNKVWKERPANSVLIDWITDGIPEFWSAILPYVAFIIPELRESVYDNKNIHLDLMGITYEEWDNIDDPIIKQEYLDKIAKYIITEYILKGSRLGGKTTYIVKLTLLLMVLIPSFSQITIMETITESTEKIMNDYEEEIEKLNEIWPGIKKRFESKRDKSAPKIVFNNGRWKQVVRFMGINELHKSGTRAPKRTFYGMTHSEELVSSSMMNQNDFEEREKIITALSNLKLTIERHIPPDWLGSINFQTFNPYNEGVPQLKDFNKHNPDNESLLKIYGFQMVVNETKGEIYHTSAVHINRHLLKARPGVLKELDTWKDKDPNYYNVIRFGMNGIPSDNVLGPVWHIVQKNQIKLDDFITKDKHSNINFQCGLDISDGKDSLSYVISAWNRKYRAIVPVAEWEWEPKKHKKADIEYIIKDMWLHLEKHMSEWNIDKGLTIEVDGSGANTFISLAVKVAKIVMEDLLKDHNKVLMKNIRLKPSWTKNIKNIGTNGEDYDGSYRPTILYNLIGTEKLMPFENLTPKFFKSLQTMKRGKKRNKIGIAMRDDEATSNIHTLNAFEMGEGKRMIKINREVEVKLKYTGTK